MTFRQLSSLCRLWTEANYRRVQVISHTFRFFLLVSSSLHPTLPAWFSTRMDRKARTLPFSFSLFIASFFRSRS
ncbi:hypothetical protein L209DRAFT_258267 [Thermothelomyces heterothallicus CBS 203.75]